MKRMIILFIGLFSLTGAMGANPQDTLRIGIYESPPFVIYKDNKSIEGVSVWLWEQMKNDLGQPFKFIRYCNEHPLKSILNDLKNGSIDLSINPITITSDRHEQINFSYPFYIGNLTIAKRASSNGQSFFSFLKKFFNKQVIHLIFVLAGMVILFGLIIWLIERKNHHFGRGFQGLLSGFWWSAVTMTTVGYGDKVPISNLGRLVAFLWMLCSLVIISIFTAIITSSLTVSKLTDSNLSVHSFRQAKIGTVEASATEAFLGRNFFKNTTSYKEFTEGLRGLRDEEVELFVYDEPWLVYQLNNNPDFGSLELMPLRFNVQLYAMPMRKDLDADFQKKVSSSLLQSLETKDWELLLEEYQLKPY